MLKGMVPIRGLADFCASVSLLQPPTLGLRPGQPPDGPGMPPPKYAFVLPAQHTHSWSVLIPGSTGGGVTSDPSLLPGSPRGREEGKERGQQGGRNSCQLPGLLRVPPGSHPPACPLPSKAWTVETSRPHLPTTAHMGPAQHALGTSSVRETETQSSLVMCLVAH